MISNPRGKRTNLRNATNILLLAALICSPLVNCFYLQHRIPTSLHRKSVDSACRHRSMNRMQFRRTQGVLVMQLPQVTEAQSVEINDKNLIGASNFFDGKVEVDTRLRPNGLQADDLRLPVGVLLAIFLAGFAAAETHHMTYLKLHLFLILPELWMRFTPTQPMSWASERLRSIAYLTPLPLAILAIAFSSMWDNFIFSKGVFTFDKGSMIGTIGAMPVEEWLWFIDHTTLASMATLSLLRPRSESELDAFHAAPPRPHGLGDRLMVAAGLAVSAAGVGLCTAADEHLLFLGVCAAFMPPVIALHWWFGLDLFKRSPREWLGGISLVSAYVLGLDWWAQQEGIWHLFDQYVTGARLLWGALPVEQGLIYSLTTVLVVQTVLFVVRVAESYEYLDRRRRLPGRGLLSDLLAALNRPLL